MPSELTYTSFDVDALAATIELAPVGIARLDLEGHFLMANQRLCQILGYERTDLIGHTFQEITFADDLEHCIRLNVQLANGEIPEYTQEKRFVRPDGSAVWTRVSVIAARGPDTVIRFLIGIAEDISAQIEAEHSRVAAESSLHSALDASLIGAFRFNVRTHSLEWEDGLQRLFGPSLKPRTTLQELFAGIHPDDLARISAAYTRSVTEGVDFDEEFRVIWEDGSVHWLHDRGHVVRDSEGQSLYITGACVDVTQSRRVQDELYRRDARFRTLANSIPQMAWIAERDGRRVWYNERWYEYTGRTFDQLRDYGWHQVIHPDDLERVRVGQRAAFRSNAEWRDTVALRRHDGEYRRFLASSVPVVDADGVVRQWFGTNTDITDQLEVQQELQELAEERQRLLTLEQSARERAERATAARDEVLAIVAHDLRNPAQTILMSAGSITDFPLAEPQRVRHMEIIKRSAWRMDRLIRDLLDVSQLEAGTLRIACERVAVAKLIDEAIEPMDVLARNSGILIEKHIETRLPRITGDPHRLQQVLENLVGNALKFTPAGGRIRVRAAVSGINLDISIEDTGCGIAPEHLDKIFRRFWQVNDRGGGVGLGLVIARGIAEAHGGSLRVESEVGRGTTFTLSIPLAASERRGVEN